VEKGFLPCPTCHAATLDRIGTERGNDGEGRPAYADIYYYCYACGHCAVASAPPGRAGAPRRVGLTPHQIVRVLKLRFLAQGESSLVAIQPHWEGIERNGLPALTGKREAS
jgi:hypothetical protein